MRRLWLATACSFALAAPSFAEDKGKKGGEETIDSILENANAAPADKGKAAPPAGPRDQPAPAPPSDTPGDEAAPVPTKKPPKPVEVAPPTDDNDGTQEAARPKALEAVQPVAQPRRPGPYELGALDSGILDGAGIERLMPAKITAGEEPDLLCRIVVTQPATIATSPHLLTVTVNVGATATYQQKRSVRVSSVGRRAIVFVIPSDRISSEEAARVTIRADLSAPANPASRTLKFAVEPAD